MFILSSSIYIDRKQIIDYNYKIHKDKSITHNSNYNTVHYTSMAVSSNHK